MTVLHGFGYLTLGLIVIFGTLALAALGIWSILYVMAQVEQLWRGTMFLGFASYVPPDERWYRNEYGEWQDRQEDMMLKIRPSLENEI